MCRSHHLKLVLRNHSKGEIIITAKEPVEESANMIKTAHTTLLYIGPQGLGIFLF